MRGDKWSEKTRSSKLASVLYPAHVSEATRREMTALAANERKRAPYSIPLLADHKRGALSPLGGVATNRKHGRSNE